MRMLLRGRRRCGRRRPRRRWRGDAVAEIELGDRAQAGRRAGAGEALGLGGGHMGAVDQAPAPSTGQVVEQPLCRAGARTRPGTPPPLFSCSAAWMWIGPVGNAAHRASELPAQRPRAGNAARSERGTVQGGDMERGSPASGGSRRDQIGSAPGRGWAAFLRRRRGHRSRAESEADARWPALPRRCGRRSRRGRRSGPRRGVVR